MTTLLNSLPSKLLAVFEGDEVLTIADVVRRSGYGLSTVMNYMARLAQAGHVHRVKHGHYSLVTRPETLYRDDAPVLAALKAKKFATTQYLTKATGIPSEVVLSCLHRMMEEGKCFRVRRGVYSS